MATIEERAEECAKKICGCNICEADRRYCPCEEFEENIEKYTEIAIEQDRIARKEERERCIKAAGAIVCKVHSCGTRVKCTPETCDKASNCGWLLELHKAIEEGGEV